MSSIPPDVRLNKVLFPLNKAVKINTNSVTISYSNTEIINNKISRLGISTGGITLEQLFALYKRMADLEIGARVFFHGPAFIELEKIGIITTLEEQEINQELLDWAVQYDKDLRTEIKKGLEHSVRVLQEQIGYCHGDLHSGNLGFRLNGDKLQVLLIDMDTAFPISIGRYIPAVQNWMENGFSWDDSYEDFVAYDYINPMHLLSEIDF